MDLAKIIGLSRSKNENDHAKVFCIGMNKTGTTSLRQFMEVHGFRCSNQREGELLIKDYLHKNWKPILRHCRSADFFQDLPFSAPLTAAVLLGKFPEARFILTIRSSPDMWYDSLTRFHRQKFGRYNHLPESEDLQTANYRYPGFAWDAHKALYPTPDNDLYNRNTLIKTYEDHIANVRKIFKDRSNLLILDLSEPDAVNSLSTFLNIEPQLTEMPWLNKSTENS